MDSIHRIRGKKATLWAGINAIEPPGDSQRGPMAKKTKNSASVRATRSRASTPEGQRQIDLPGAAQLSGPV